MEKNESGLAGKLYGCVSSMAISPLSRSGFRKRKTQKGEKKNCGNRVMNIYFYDIHTSHFIYLVLLNFKKFGFVSFALSASTLIHHSQQVRCNSNSQETIFFL